MLLPQSSAFAALKNRLNSVSAIGYLHIAPRAYATFSHPNPSISLYFSDLPGRNPNANPSPSRSPATPSSTFDRPNRLKAREESIIKWADLLDKFKTVQEKARRGQRMLQNRLLEDGDARHGANLSTTQQDGIGSAGAGEIAGRKDSMTLLADLPRQQPLRPLSAGSVGQRAAQPLAGQGPGQAQGMGMGHKPKSSLGNLGRLAGGGGGGGGGGPDEEDEEVRGPP
jgi:vacuole morphology and inheritance protein 14